MNNIWVLTAIAVGIGLITLHTDLPAGVQFGLGVTAMICAVQAVRLIFCELKEKK